jgi:hypothetical protein
MASSLRRITLAKDIIWSLKQETLRNLEKTEELPSFPDRGMSLAGRIISKIEPVYGNILSCFFALRGLFPMEYWK